VMHINEAAALLEPAIAEFADIDDSILARMKLSLARAEMALGNFKRSLQLLDEVLETAERRSDIETVVAGLLARGNALSLVGRRREFLGITTLTRDLARQNGLTDVMLRAMGNLGIAQTDIDLAATMELYLETIELSRKAGDRASVLNTVGNFLYAGFLAGEWDRALDMAATYLDEDLSPRAQLVILTNLLVIRAARGEDVREDLDELEVIGKALSGSWHLFLADPEAAAAMAAGDLKQAHDLYIEIADTDLSQAAEYLYRAARCALWTRDIDDAKGLLARLDETGAQGPTISARRKTMVAGVVALERQTPEALSLYREALAAWRGVHCVFDEAMTGLDMAELLDPADPEVAAAVNASRLIFDRLRAAPYLARLEAAVSRTAAPPARRAAGRQEVAVAD
jgi:tetratricopeptide (TPR) repeat protein